MKILAVCQSGLGTSFMAEMNIRRTLVDLRADVDDFEVGHADMGGVSSDMAGYFFIEHSLEDTPISIPDEKLVPSQSIIDSDEVKEKVEQILSKE